MTLRASAPGKIVLAGEYAVLRGAPAVCMAIDRRARAAVRHRADGECHVTSPGFGGADRFGIVDAVTQGRRPACDIELDTRAFMCAGRKTGIGSSAALTVALLAALGNTTDVYEQALAAHRRLQDGAGSGVDIAAAVHGGLLRFEMPTNSVRAMGWPEGLAYRVIWTGVSASTADRLAKLAQATARPSQSTLQLAAAGMADAWQTGDADRILDDYVDYIGILRRFSIDHDLGIFDAGHDELTDAAMVDGLVYKPAGAGGGDIGVLFGRDDAQLDTFVRRHGARIRALVPCALDTAGVRLEP